MTKPITTLPDDHILTMGDAGHWPLQYFRPEELRCKGSGKLLIPIGIARNLDMLRHKLGKPIHIVSAFRGRQHNKLVGGAKNSYHLRGRAFDIQTSTMSASDVAELVDTALSLDFNGLGVYRTFIHIDDGPRRIWHG